MDGALDTEGEGAHRPVAPKRTGRDTGRRLRGAIANKIGVAILSGAYAPGATLSTELTFAESLAVSRSAVREALQALAAKGLVQSRPKTGTRVLPRERWNLLDPDVLAWAFSGEPDAALVRDLFELRATIEPAVAGMAALRHGRADLKRMRDALAGMRRHTLATEAGRAADRDFHDAMLHATDNQAFITLSASIGAAVTWTTFFKYRAATLPRDGIPDHARVYDAIAARDEAGAIAAMRELVGLALDDTRASMAPRDEGRRT